jgi:hypothetical protein
MKPCRDCKQEQALPGFVRCAKHLELRREQKRRWKANRPEVHRRLRSKHGRANRMKFRDKNAALKDVVYAHYGGYRCACCGVTEKPFLTLDHPDGSGYQMRKNKVYRSWPYYWIVKNGFPEKLQVLCWNCNCGRQRNGGICPHAYITTNK